MQNLVSFKQISIIVFKYFLKKFFIFEYLSISLTVLFLNAMVDLLTSKSLTMLIDQNFKSLLQHPYILSPTVGFLTLDLLVNHCDILTFFYNVFAVNELLTQFLFHFLLLIELVSNFPF